MPIAVTNPICTWCGKPDNKCVCGQARPVAQVAKPKVRLALTTSILGFLGQLTVWLGAVVIGAPFVGAIAGAIAGGGRESLAAGALMLPWTLGAGAGMIWSGGVIYLMVQLIKVGMWQREE